jgi:translation initiation factor RLI1
MKTTVIDEISRYLDLDRETLLARGLKTLLQKRKRAILLERLQILLI